MVSPNQNQFKQIILKLVLPGIDSGTFFFSAYSANRSSTEVVNIVKFHNKEWVCYKPWPFPRCPKIIMLVSVIKIFEAILLDAEVDDIFIVFEDVIFTLLKVCMEIM